MVSAFEAFKVYQALKKHFTSDSYDVVKSKGAIKAFEPAFERRNDKALFQRMADKFKTPRELVQYLVSNMSHDNLDVVYSQQKGDEIYEKWVARKQSRTESFKDDLRKIRNYLEANKRPFEDLFNIDENSPLLLILYLRGIISLETLVIIDEYENYLSDWDQMVIVWKDSLRVISKVKPFIKFDKQKLQTVYSQFKEIVKD